ncbi:MAG TPA: hypothetical protein VNL18_04175 [Gemmatimonadales bacterium]|nr:hypothetical protein [Gemmatimonadales bacterium]
MKRTFVLAAIAAVVTTSTVNGQGIPISIGVRASTLGLGGELALGLTDRVELRGVGNYFSLDRDMDLSGTPFNVDLKLRSAGALLDLYLAGPLRLTAGGMWNGNNLSGNATISGTVSIGDSTYTATQVGRLDATLDFKKFAPYVGFGFSGRGRVSFFFDLGLVLQGSPDISYVPTTTLTGAARTTLLAEVDKEITQVEDDISFFKYYPVVGLGLRFKL